MKRLTLSFFAALSLYSANAAACPDRQHEECLIPRPWPAKGCAQKICVPNIDDLGKDVLCEPFGTSGAAGYASAAELQSSRHSSGQQLHPKFKFALRREFGELIDSVRVHYSATMLDGFKVGDKYINYPSDAQTFGSHIYFNSAENDVPLSLLAHELTHTSQWASRGSSLSKFGHDYFSDWCKAGFSYQNNKFEEHARDVERRYGDQTLANLPEPTVTLADFHSGCTFPSSHSNECQSAIHSYIAQQGLGGAGLAQEVGDNVYGIAAFNAPFYGDIGVAELKEYHGDCNFPEAQSNACVSAIQRACNKRGYGAGLAQQIGNQVYGVACTNVGWYGDISLSELRSLHNGCTFPHAQSNECVSAIHRACVTRGFTAGFAQQIGNQVYGVACLNSTWYGDVNVRP
ncbi:MAG TPA: DUF4157 domain-containing protein [Oligoflexus sp.]|uniref:eCIS core domain-containing protein n=1 Tax=Oligoflexus sp. TaxID=1971216 RepID=UPI002D546719|nr:DUF4157 domain-containing protein [Oligoflexus sp.]HYX39589.1 DUF4157 domain-containing protein [Oligoflexus sp.]